MTAITQALSAALLHFVWQGFAVALLLWITLVVLRNASANARYIAGCAALMVLALLPAITACVLYTRPVMATTVEFARSVSQPVRGAWTSSARVPGVWLARLQSWALPTWSLGVLLFSLRLVWGSKQVATLRRRGVQAEDAVLAMLAEVGRRMGLTRSVRVLISTITEGPSVVGWIRPVILLPSATILGLTPQQLEAVLAHEIAHIRRNDYLVNILQILVETLLFYHPAVWWTSARIRRERELCCDDLAVRSCGDALCYARALTTLERLRVMAPSLALGSTDGPLLFRIQRLIGVETQEQLPAKLPGIVALTLGVACLALNINWARAQAQVRSSEPVRAELASGPQVRDARGVQVDVGGAAMLHRMPVVYPEAAIQKGVQGTVVVEATLDARGEVEDARVLSGPPELRKEALASVLDWHFVPDAGGVGGARRVSIAFQLAAVEVNAEPQEAKRAEEERAHAKLFFFAGGPGSGDGGSKEVAEGEARVARLQLQLYELKKMRLTGPQNTAQQVQSRLDELSLELEETKRVAEAAANQEERAEAQPESEGEGARKPFFFPKASGLIIVSPISESLPSGRKLKTINVRGLSEQSRDELVLRLPVHVGDTLSRDSIKALGAAVRQFDEHLELNLIPIETGEVELRIVAPGSGLR